MHDSGEHVSGGSDEWHRNSVVATEGHIVDASAAQARIQTRFRPLPHRRAVESQFGTTARDGKSGRDRVATEIGDRRGQQMVDRGGREEERQGRGWRRARPPGTRAGTWVLVRRNINAISEVCEDEVDSIRAFTSSRR